MYLPKKSQLFDKIERSNDFRGSIESIVDEPVCNVSIIDSESGVIRSNHYHHVDFHFMYVLEGEIDYFFKQIDQVDIGYYKVGVGSTIFTPPKEIHACFFPVATRLIVSSKNPRDQNTYESDTVRVEFLTHGNIKDMLAKYG